MVWLVRHSSDIGMVRSRHTCWRPTDHDFPLAPSRRRGSIISLPDSPASWELHERTFSVELSIFLSIHRAKRYWEAGERRPMGAASAKRSPINAPAPISRMSVLV